MLYCAVLCRAVPAAPHVVPPPSPPQALHAALLQYQQRRRAALAAEVTRLTALLAQRGAAVGGRGQQEL